MFLLGLLGGFNKPPATGGYVSKAIIYTYTSAFSFGAQNIGTADGSRLVIVAVGYSPPGAATAVAIGGIGATQVVASTDGSYDGVSLWQAVVPTGTTATIVVNFSGNVAGCEIGVYSLYNLVSNSAYSATNNAGNGGGGTPVSNALGLSTPASGFMICAGGINSSYTNNTVTGMTVNYDDTLTGCGCAGYNITIFGAFAGTSAGSVSLSFGNWYIYNWAAVAATWR